MAWYLNPFLTAWRAAVDKKYPNRSKASDGTIGDLAHQGTDSDHNPDPAGQPDAGSVDAFDMDIDLVPGDRAASLREVEFLKGEFQKQRGARYWIHNRQIAHKRNGWRRDPYTGSNPHTEHVHWNSDESGENDAAVIVLGGILVSVEDTITWEIRPWTGSTLTTVQEMQKQQDTDTERLKTLVAEVAELEADSDAAKAKAAEAEQLQQKIASHLTEQMRLIEQMATVIDALASGGVTQDMLVAAFKQALREGVTA